MCLLTFCVPSHLFSIRGEPLQGPPRLGHGGEEPLSHVHRGNRHVCPHAPHPVQVLLQAEVKAAVRGK